MFGWLQRHTKVMENMLVKPKHVLPDPPKGLTEPKLLKQWRADKYNAGYVPKELLGKVLMRRQMAEDGQTVIGWHWYEPEVFKRRYHPLKVLFGGIKSDPYIDILRREGLI